MYADVCWRSLNHCPVRVMLRNKPKTSSSFMVANDAVVLVKEAVFIPWISCPIFIHRSSCPFSGDSRLGLGCVDDDQRRRISLHTLPGHGLRPRWISGLGHPAQRHAGLWHRGRADQWSLTGCGGRCVVVWGRALRSWCRIHLNGTVFRFCVDSEYLNNALIMNRWKTAWMRFYGREK